MKRVRRDIVGERLEVAIKDLQEACDMNVKQEKLVGSRLVVLEKIYEEYCRISEDILETTNGSEEEFRSEYLEAHRWDNDVEMVRYTSQMVISALKEDDVKTVSQSRTCSYRLPKLEFKKFGGEPKDWLEFESQFRSIHEDEGMSGEEKFRYLIQATIPGSAARKVVESFPSTAKNYPLAMQYLQERFGDKDMLIEVYVRSLLGLVLSGQKESKPLTQLYDELETQLRSLDSLDVKIETFGILLYPLVESTLSEEIIKLWERQSVKTKKSKDKLTGLMEFLRTEVDGESRVNLAKQFTVAKERRDDDRKHFKQKEKRTTAVDLLNTSGKKGCTFCEQSHGSVDNCEALKKLNLDERRSLMKEKRVCYTCLRSGHQSNQCQAKMECKICRKRHHHFLCKEDKKAEKTVENKHVESTLLSNHNCPVLMQTMIVRVLSGEKIVRVRALIDTGCSRSYISEKAAEFLGLKADDKVSLSHGLFGGTTTEEIEHKLYEITVTDLEGNRSLLVPVLEEKLICGNVSRIPSGEWLEEFKRKGIEFSDVGDDARDVNLLLGADVAAEIFTGEIKKSKSGPTAFNTIFGWTLMGKLRTGQEGKLSVANLNLMNLDYSMQSLWSLEAIGIKEKIEVNSSSERTSQALKKFQEKIIVNEIGRYEVALPWIGQHPPVADNYDLAKKSLMSATKKLKKQDKVEAYDKVFQEWEELGIIEEVEDAFVDGSSFLPHRPVFNPSSITTPIRPVFNASARSGGLPSLNDCLEKGENLIELVPAILSRFRLNKIGISSDIKKAFLQISVNKEDRKFLRFLWWKKTSEDIEQPETVKIYQHARVVFGVNCSPFLLAATLGYHLDNFGTDMSALLKKSLYVDNCLISVDSEKDAESFIKEASSLMMDKKFELRGWITSGSLEKEQEKVLGMLWNLKEDSLLIDVDESQSMVEAPVTKRKILSAAHRLYDPLGMVSPVSIKPKLILQDLWDKKIGWDDQVPADVEKKFVNWVRDLIGIKSMKIPRWITCWKLKDCELSFHLFTDASKYAYAGCVFLRSEKNGEVCIQLVMSKSRVAPRNGTIPRLELLGCLIGSRLLDNVKSYLEMEAVKCYQWTDSANALYWIKNEDNWAPFVYNRVKEINMLTDKQMWRHVSGEDNPADLPSRGCSVKQLVDTQWWKGPEWLRNKEEEWPMSGVNAELEVVLAEKKKSVFTLMNISKDDPLFWTKKISSYGNIVRVLKCLKKLRQPDEDCNLKSGLTSVEVVLWKLVQQESYGKDSQVFKQLHTVIDDQGLIRVKTKIVHRDDTECFRFPVLIPHDHHLTEKLIRMEHFKMKHSGIGTLMCHLRQKFWITKARQTIRRVISKCIVCRRYKVKAVQVPESSLPKDRVRDANSFEVTGVDLGGPLYLSDGKKVWFVLFTCAVYRAIHLELTMSLSTEDFTNCLRRFIARRGKPSVIYSDNGKNFVGFANALEKWKSKQSGEVQSFHGIKWIFNVPAAPWWGGFWEVMIGMVKKLLRKNVGKLTLTYDELSTIMCELEVVINSRPLTYVGESQEDLIPLSPNMFLNGWMNTQGDSCLDNPDLVTVLNKKKSLLEELKVRFRNEYLGRLKNFKRSCGLDKIKVGDAVWIGADNVKRQNWPSGVITELICGREGHPVAAKLKTIEGIISRPLQRLYPMEIDQSNVDNGQIVAVVEENLEGMKLRSGKIV